MDTETIDPYGKRKIELDSQTDDYLRSLNKDFEIDKDTTRIFGKPYIKTCVKLYIKIEFLLPIEI
ncbi:hypothetical protein Godav_020996, partial [Gossypium davidsonii]|nr:hypothetical protein [Gossypium davidsonii]